MSAKRKTQTSNGFERYAEGPVTTTRRYLVSAATIREIQKLAPVYASQGRAIQVGTEILIRLKRRVKVTNHFKDTKRLTYKLTPRTIELIDALTEQYGTTACAFAAILNVLKQGV